MPRGLALGALLDDEPGGADDTGVFNAAGLMVPEPSIMFPPRPFIDVVTTGCDAEYMAYPGGWGLGWSSGVGADNRRTEWCWDARERACRKQEVEAGGEAVNSVWCYGRRASDGQRREALHAA